MRSNISNRYDVAIIGAGFAGMAAALDLAKIGNKVLLVEKHWTVGGCASWFRKDGYYFDAGAHYLGGCRAGGHLGDFLRDHRIREDLSIIRPVVSDVLCIPPKKVFIRTNFEELICEFQSHFPNSRQEIEGFFRFIKETDSTQLYLRLRKNTFQDVLQEYFPGESLLHAFLAIPLANIGLPPSKASALAAVFMYRDFVIDGGYYPIGGFKALCEAIVKQYKCYGGDLMLATQIDKIEVHNDSVKSITFSKVRNRTIPEGLKIEVGSLIITCDPNKVSKMLGQGCKFSRLLDEKCKKRIPSISACMLHLGIDFDINSLIKDKCYSWYSPTADIEATYGSWLTRKVDFSDDGFLFCGSPSIHDSNLNAKGKSSLHLITGAPFMSEAYWAKNKYKMADAMISRLEKIIPGVASKIEKRYIAVPQTIGRYTGNSFGAMYGWASLVNQVADNKFGHKVGIRNLYFAGHWSGPLGVPMVVHSGRHAARLAARALTRRYLVNK